MANELKFSITPTLENGSLKWSYPTGVKLVTQTTKAVYHNTQIVGTSEETLAMGADLVAYGYCLLVNLDTTNYVEFGPDSGGSAGTMVAMGKLKAGECAWIRLKPGITIKAQANTAAVRLYIAVLDD